MLSRRWGLLLLRVGVMMNSTKPTFPSQWFQAELVKRGVSLRSVVDAAVGAGVCSSSTIQQWIYRGTMPNAYTWLWVCRFLDLNPLSAWDWSEHPGPSPDMGSDTRDLI